MDQPSSDRDRPRVRTFHARTGRLSNGRRRALADLLPRFAPSPDERPTAVDLGCGRGEVLLDRAARQPGRLWLGIDVHRASLATLARSLAESGLANVRLHLGDGVEFLDRRIGVESLQVLQVLFPDPWPKTAHRARRLVQPAFAALVARLLAPGGRLELATDRADYAAQMIAVLGGCPRLGGGPCSRPDRPVTYYERAAREHGRAVIDLLYTAGPSADAGPAPASTAIARAGPAPGAASPGKDRVGRH